MRKPYFPLMCGNPILNISWRWYDLENNVKVTKILPNLFPLPTMYKCKFGQNASTGSEDNAQKQSNADAIHIKTNMGDIILKKNIVFNSLKINFVLANSADPDGMLHDYAAFHLGLHC